MIKKNYKILKLKLYLNKIPLPGFEGISFLNLFQFERSFLKGNFAIRSAAVSFHFFVGIFPTLIFFIIFSSLFTCLKDFKNTSSIFRKSIT